MKANKKVAVLGASSDPGRYSHQCVSLLREKGYEPIPVNPNEKEVLGIPCLPQLQDVRTQVGEVDTLTLYVNPRISSSQQEAILQLRPRRVIFNPGAENPLLAQILEEKGIEVEEACSLVLLRTAQF